MFWPRLGHTLSEVQPGAESFEVGREQVQEIAAVDRTITALTATPGKHLGKAINPADLMPPSHIADANNDTTLPAGTACIAGVASTQAAAERPSVPSSIQNEGVLAGDDSDEELPDAAVQLLCMGLRDQQQHHSSPTAGLAKQGGSMCRPPDSGPVQAGHLARDLVSVPVQADHLARDPGRRHETDCDGALSIVCRPATCPGLPRPHGTYGGCLLEVPSYFPHAATAPACSQGICSSVD